MREDVDMGVGQVRVYLWNDTRMRHGKRAARQLATLSDTLTQDSRMKIINEIRGDLQVWLSTQQRRRNAELSYQMRF